MKTIIDKTIELALCSDALMNCEPIGQDSDSSLIVLSALGGAGFLVAQNGASYTGNMYSSLKKCGFEDVTADVDLETGDGLKVGDVLLTPKKSTAIYTESGLVNDPTGGKPYSNLPWRYVLRYPHIVQVTEDKKEAVAVADPKPKVTEPTKGTFWGKVVCSTVTLNIRKKPNGTILPYSAPRGSRQLFEDKDYNGWYRLADGTGYCSAKHIKKI